MSGSPKRPPFALTVLLLALLPALTLGWAPLGAARASDSEGGEPIVTTDLLKIRTAGQVDVSPDGRRAVYVVTSMGKGSDGELRYLRHLWLAELDGDTPPRQLTHGERSDGAPTFSPDGSRIAFVRGNDDPSHPEAQIWILPLAGGEAWRLTDAEHGASDPRWSPDGTRILYASDVPMWALEGEPPWPEERPGRGFRDAPSWPAIEHARERSHSDADEEAEPAPPKPEGEVEPAAKPAGSLAEIRSWLAKNAADGNPKVLTRLNLQGEHALEPDLSFSHLFVIDAAPGPPEAGEREPKLVAGGFQSFHAADWAPDGTWIAASSLAVTEHPDRVLDSDLWSVRADGSGAAPLLDWEGEDGSWSVYGARFSPDGKTLLFGASDRSEPFYSLTHLAAMPASGGAPRLLTPGLDLDADDAAWSDDGRWVYFTTRKQGAFPLLRAPAAGGVPAAGGAPEAVETVIGGPRGIGSFDLEGDRLVYAATEVSDPSELYAAAADGSGERRLGSLNADWLAGKRIVQPTEHWLTRPDGQRIQYWVMEPAGLDLEGRPGVRYPVALEIHGGPSAMWGPGERTMWHELQLLASWGYGVVYSNPRGSSGYGFDFKKANFRSWGTEPAGDALAALDEAVELPWADPEQLFLAGGSYAGYLTAWIVGHDQRFDAAVAQRGVYDLSFFFGEGNAWRLVPFHFGGYPWEAETRAVLDASSPLTYVENIHTPLLIIHSDRDLRTGTNESETLYKSLKVLGRPVEYVRYPEEGHDLSRTGNPKRRMDRLDRIVEFFERFVEHPEAPPAAGG
jgi:dipeptidyl aminopeptidase/acylaminoacyl peptidase